MYGKKIKDYESIEETQNIKSSYDDGEFGMETEQKKSYKTLIIAIFVIVFFFGLIAYLFMTKIKSPNSQTNQQVQSSQQNPQIPQNLVAQTPTNSQNQQNNQTSQQNQPPQQSQNFQQNQPVPQIQSSQQNQTAQQNQPAQQIQSSQQNQAPQQTQSQQNQPAQQTGINQTLQFNYTSIKRKNHTNIPINELLPKTNKKDVNNITEILKSKRLYINNKPISNEYIKFVKPLNETIEVKYSQILFPNLTFDNYTFVHVHNYSMYLSYLNKSKTQKKNKTRTHHNDTIIGNHTDLNHTNNKSNATISSLNNLTNLSFINPINNTNNQSLINSINSSNNQSLINSINNASNQSLANSINIQSNQSSSNPINSGNNQSLSNPINSGNNQSLSNPINSGNNQSLSNPINSGNNQSSSNPINSGNNQSSSNPINSGNNQSLSNPINSGNNQSLSNPINSGNNQSLSNPINSGNNQSLTNLNNSANNLISQNNNSLTNISHNLRSLYINDNNSSRFLKDFYLACDRRKLLTVKKNKNESYEEPLISVIIPFFNKKLEILRTIRSVQLQTLTNIEIIIVDDGSTSIKKTYKDILDNDYRIRIFTQNKNMGLWRKRIDGFLYSRGEYILHINPGDILSDSFVLEDLCKLVHQYNLDTVRFTFTKTNYDSFFKKKILFKENKIYPSRVTKIVYGRPNYNVHIFGYGTIWNRLVRSSILRKALDLVDDEILNIHKDLWEDMWWNDLIDRVSFSNLVVNRLGYTFLYDRKNIYEPRDMNKFLKDKTVREFILFWLFDLKLLPKNDNKELIIHNLRRYNNPDNRFAGIRISLHFLLPKFKPYELLLSSLIEDPFVSAENKVFVKKLYEDFKNKSKH